MRDPFLSAGADDIPKKGSSAVFGQVLFAKDKVEYHGQPLGLIVAESQVPHTALLTRSSSMRD